jgi:hypothetical protein
MNISGIPFFPPSRAVIMMMDEGVCVHRVAGGSATYLDSVSWRTPDFEVRLTAILNEAKVTSVLILNDAVEQHYRKERIAIPTSFDKANIIKRRLNVAFPSYPMRAAIELKEQPGVAASKKDDKEVDKSKPYLFAASPSTETFSRLIRSISATDYNLFGYGLLPIESAGMLKVLAQKLAEKRKAPTKAEWTILVGQHRGGGLRQIVVRNSELALTRVTPVEEPKPGFSDVWAKDVSRELQATLSYLSRFGYSPDDGLNIIIIGSKEFADVLDGMISVPSNFESLSTFEAGKLLGIKLHFADGDHFSDGLHAAWSGKKLTLDLPLSAKEITDISGPRKVASVAMILLTCALGVGLYQSSEEAQGLYEDSRNFETSQTQLKEIERIYQDEIKKKAALGIDVNAITSSLDIDNRIRRQHIDVLGLLKVIGGELNSLRIDSFEFKNEGDVLWSSPSKTDLPPTRKATLELSFSYAGNTNPQDGNKEMDDLVSRLNAKLSGMDYLASVSTPLQNLTFSGAVDREVGLTANLRSLSDRYTSKILIQKVDHVKSPGQ